MEAAHEVDVEACDNEHVAPAEHVQPPHRAVHALELRDAVDFGGLQHGLCAAQDGGHVGVKVFSQLVAERPAEYEHVGGKQALDAAGVGCGMGQQGSSEGGGGLEDLNGGGGGGGG